MKMSETLKSKVRSYESNNTNHQNLIGGGVLEGRVCETHIPPSWVGLEQAHFQNCPKFGVFSGFRGSNTRVGWEAVVCGIRGGRGAPMGGGDRGVHVCAKRHPW